MTTEHHPARRQPTVSAGRRRYPDAYGVVVDPAPGDYWLVERIDQRYGTTEWVEEWWWLMTPNGHPASLRLPSAHTVTEHSDGTISVMPAVRVADGEGCIVWTGWLEHGQWRSD